MNSFTYFKEISKSILESAECKSLEKDYLILKSWVILSIKRVRRKEHTIKKFFSLSF